MLNPLDVGINTGPDRVVTKAMPKNRLLAVIIILYLEARFLCRVTRLKFIFYLWTRVIFHQHALLSQVSCLQRVVLQGLEGIPMLPIL